MCKGRPTKSSVKMGALSLQRLAATALLKLCCDPLDASGVNAMASLKFASLSVGGERITTSCTSS